MHHPPARIALYLLSCLATFLIASATHAEVLLVPSQFGTISAAVSAASDGDIIEIAAGTYSGTILIEGSNGTKNLTLRAAQGALVTLTGNNSSPVMRYAKPSVSSSSIVFQGLRFANGRSTQNAIGGGITITRGNATFIDCTFENNTAVPTNTGGGAMFIFDNSVVHIFSSTYNSNTTPNFGGAIRLGDGCELYIHDSEFTNNSTSVSGHKAGSAGGAVHMTNAILQISNSRFDNNTAACVGGAVFNLGSPWVSPVEVPKGTTHIVNSTFTNNSAVPFGAQTCSFTPVGGAIHSENQVELFVIQSRLERNSATSGGAISQYRSKMTIDDSTLRGNFVTGADSARGFGGAILSNSNDAVDDTTAPNGTTNRPSSTMTIRESFFQGRFGGTTEAGVNGGCIWIGGDSNRTYGRFNVPAQGDAASNRAQVTIDDTIFTDCDVDSPSNAAGKGGAITAGHTALTIRDSLLIDSDATDGGGALWILQETATDISGTTFASNTGQFGGAINASGSTLNINTSQFFDNQTSTQGAAIWSAEADGTAQIPVDLDALGTVQTSTFSDNGDGSNMPDIYERDRNTSGFPINRMRYVNNEFFDAGNGNVFQNQLTGTESATGINSLTVPHAQNGVNVDKGSGNSVISTQPNLGMLVAAPNTRVPVTAAGDAASTTTAFLGYAWNGSSATLDGVSLGSDVAGTQAGGAAVHTLSVGSEDFLATINNVAGPAASLSFSPNPLPKGGGTSSLQWSRLTGNFLDVSTDRGTSLPETDSGSVNVTRSTTTEYQLLMLTNQGGAWETETLTVGGDVELIFQDGFELGNTSAWSATVN